MKQTVNLEPPSFTSSQKKNTLPRPSWPVHEVNPQKKQSKTTAKLTNMFAEDLQNQEGRDK